MGLLDWLSDEVFGGSSGGSSSPMPPVQTLETSPSTAPSLAAGMPPVQPIDTTPSVPLPQPRPADAPGPTPGPAPAPNAALPPNAAPTSGTGGPAATPPGPPVSLAPPAPGPTTPASVPGQTWLGRALGITPDQAANQGRQIGSGLAAGLSSVGQNWNKPGLAAFAGSMGAAMQGGQKEQQAQAKQATDYLNAAIKAKQAGDDAGYKQNYLNYLAAKLKADTDKAANPNASAANKNDSSTQLYLSAQRLVQPDVRAMNTELQQMRKDGADPAVIAQRQQQLQAQIDQKLQGHYAALGIHPQTAAQLAQQPGNSEKNPIDASKVGITADNIAKKLQPGQYYRNPSDGKIYQYEGPPKGKNNQAVSGVPSQPTAPEPINPMKPYQTPAEGASSDDNED